jgi:arginine decarboxylase
MWEKPSKVILTGGVGTGNTLLNAFDKALLDAGIGNLNLIKASSVIPAGAKVSKLRKDEPLEVAHGTFVPVVYTYITSDTVGERIASAIAVGKPHSRKKHGMIFEASIVNVVNEAYDIVIQMMREAFEARGMEIKDIIIEGSELVVNSDIGCVVTAAVFLP